MSKKTLGLPVRQAGVLALLGSTFIWGLGPVISKQGLLEVPPFSLGFLRLVLALFIILPFSFSGVFKVKRVDLPGLFLIGLFGSGILGAFFLLGLERTSATASAAIFATVPLFNSIAASLILKEQSTLVRILGIVIGFLGSSLITLGPALFGKGSINGDTWGNFLILGAVFSWVAYIIGSKKLLEKYPPLTIITYSLIAGVITLFPLTFSETLRNPNWYLNVTSSGLFSILYGGILGGVVAFTLFQWGMKYTSAFEAGIVVYLQLVITDIFAVPILGEKLSPIFLVGTALILGGVFLASSYELIKQRSS